MKPLIDRGIVKMQSLYLEVEQEMPKINAEEDADTKMIESRIEESKDFWINFILLFDKLGLHLSETLHNVA